MPHRPSLVDRAISGLAVFAAEAAVALAAILVALLVAAAVSVIV